MLAVQRPYFGAAFQSILASVVRTDQRTRIESSYQHLSSSSEKAAVDEMETALFEDQEGVTMHTFTLKEHRPLGCTVEESLSSDDPGAHAVFVAHVKEGGHAATAGMEAGDVIVAATGIFGDLEAVQGLGIDKVRQLVGARPDEEALELRVARGTDVLARHEAALAELCANPVDDDTEHCMLEYIKGTYYSDEEEDETVAASNDEEECNPETDEDCVIDSLHSLWAEDLPPVAPVKAMGDDSDDASSADNQQSQVKPWSSRTSPSGTWARDPATGEMRNIDA